MEKEMKQHPRRPRRKHKPGISGVSVGVGHEVREGFGDRLIFCLWSEATEAVAEVSEGLRQECLKRGPPWGVVWLCGHDLLGVGWG